GSGVKIAEGMKKTAPDGAVSGMPAIRETGPGKNLQAITVSTRATTSFVVRQNPPERLNQRLMQPLFLCTHAQFKRRFLIAAI
ncbi:hypothetical protein E0I13_19000, partial [Escherichia coli]